MFGVGATCGELRGVIGRSNRGLHELGGPTVKGFAGRRRDVLDEY